MHHTPRLRLVIFPGFLEKAFTFEPVSNDFGDHLISSKFIIFIVDVIRGDTKKAFM